MISILSPKAFRKTAPEGKAYKKSFRKADKKGLLGGRDKVQPPSGNTQPYVDRIAEPSIESANSVGQGDSAMAPIINIAQVNKTYPNGTPALAGINFSLNKGDFLFITGPSGAGKSTLLKMLYGQERPTSGRIHINGQEITKLKGDRLALLRRRIGVIFQDYKLIPKRTVAENVAFVLHAQGYSRKEIDRR